MVQPRWLHVMPQTLLAKLMLLYADFTTQILIYRMPDNKVEYIDEKAKTETPKSINLFLILTRNEHRNRNDKVAPSRMQPVQPDFGGPLLSHLMSD